MESDLFGIQLNKKTLLLIFTDRYFWRNAQLVVPRWFGNMTLKHLSPVGPCMEIRYRIRQVG